MFWWIFAVIFFKFKFMALRNGTLFNSKMNKSFVDEPEPLNHKRDRSQSMFVRKRRRQFMIKRSSSGSNINVSLFSSMETRDKKAPKKRTRKNCVNNKQRRPFSRRLHNNYRECLGIAAMTLPRIDTAPILIFQKKFTQVKFKPIPNTSYEEKAHPEFQREFGALPEIEMSAGAIGKTSEFLQHSSPKMVQSKTSPITLSTTVALMTFWLIEARASTGSFA